MTSTRVIVSLAMIGALAGCGGVGAKLTFSDVEKHKVTEIKITGDSGNVMVKTAAIAETRINRIIYQNSDPGPSYRVEGNVLHVDTNCGSDCRATYEITAPEGVKVTGKLSSGDIGLTAIAAADVTVTSGNVMVQGATGDVRAVSTSGDLRVTDVAGKTTLQATSGNAEAMDVHGPVDVRVTSGDVNVHLRDQASVKAVATNGDVEVVVPRGSYKVTTDVRSGEEHTEGGITTDPSSKFTLDLSAVSGNVTLVADPGA